MSNFSWRRWLSQLKLKAVRRTRGFALHSASSESLEPRIVMSAISLIADINPGNQSSSLYLHDNDPPFEVVGNNLYFLADDGTHGIDLWKTDGTTGGTTLVKDFPAKPGPYADVGISDLTASGGKLFFQYDDGVHGDEVWVTDGTEAGTKLLKDINPNGSSVDHNSRYPDIDMVDFNGTLYFTASDGTVVNFTTNCGLWKSDGTTAGTVVVADLNSANPLSFPEQFAVLDDKLIFAGMDSHSNTELWISDGTSAGTMLLKDIGGQNGQGLFYLAYLNQEFLNVNGTLYFLADDGVHGRELWKSDGTANGTVLAVDLTPGENGSQYIISAPIAVGNQLFFTSHDDTLGYELWVSDGTDGGTHLVKDINPGEGDGVYTALRRDSFVDLNGVLIFTADDGVHGEELWKSDGTAAGTKMVADLTPGDISPRFENLIVAGDLVYFGFDDGTHGNELWQTDGTAAGTKLVQDLNPHGNGFLYAQNLKVDTDFNGRPVFLGNNGHSGGELFIVTDQSAQKPVINPQNLSVAENSAANTVVGTVAASDPGGLTLTYSISDGNDSGAFTINSSTGQIKVANPAALDFEMHPVFTLTVTVANTADQASSAAITITLTDANDAPVLTPATFNVSVNAVHGDSVGSAAATDPDAGQQLTYSITNGNTNNAFAIDPSTGEISVNNAAALDLATTPVFHLSIEVTDNGVPPKPAVATFTINLFDPADTNDIPVLALNGGPAEFVKKSPPVTIVPNITVTDPDQSAAFRLAGGQLIITMDIVAKKKKVFDSIDGLNQVSSIGSITNQSTTNGKLQTTIQLSDAGTPAAVEAYLRSLTFTTKGRGLKIPTRTVDIQATDSAGATSNLLHQTINVHKKPVVVPM